MSTLSITIDNEPTIFTKSPNSNGFILRTLSKDSPRQYKIIRDYRGYIYYMNFTISFTEFDAPNLVTKEIPYIRSNFSVDYDSSDANIDGPAEPLEPGIYRFMCISKDTNKELPAEINLDVVYKYTVGLTEYLIRFVFFRKLEIGNIYTTYLGNKYTGDISTLPDPNTLTDDQVSTGNHPYIPGETVNNFIIKIDTVPNIIYNVQDFGSGIIKPDFYFVNNERYEIRMIKLCIVNFPFTVILRIRNIDGEYFTDPARTFTVPEYYEITNKFLDSDEIGPFYNFSIKYTDATGNVAFKIV